MTAPLPPVTVKTSRVKCALLGLALCGLALWLAASLWLGGPSPLAILLRFFGALFLGGFGVYFLAIALFRPVALRMDHDGISGYYIPPMRWHEIGDVARYEERSKRGAVFIVHVAIRVNNTGPLYNAFSASKYDRVLNLARRTGYHILIPQIILGNMDAVEVSATARRFQSAARAPR